MFAAVVLCENLGALRRKIRPWRCVLLITYWLEMIMICSKSSSEIVNCPELINCLEIMSFLEIANFSEISTSWQSLTFGKYEDSETSLGIAKIDKSSFLLSAFPDAPFGTHS